MGSSEMDQRIRDDTHNHTKTSNDVCRHKDELLYGSKTAMVVIIARVYASGHNGTESTMYHGLLFY